MSWDCDTYFTAPAMALSRKHRTLYSTASDAIQLEHRSGNSSAEVLIGRASRRISKFTTRGAQRGQWRDSDGDE